MCGRYTLTRPEAVMHALMGDAFQGLEGLGGRYNVAPTQQVPVVRDGSKPELVSMRWGLVPSWARRDKKLPTLINARCETIHEKPSFRAAFRVRRCVVIADGFYEWERVGKQRLPWLFRREAGEGFGMAGIWERWTGEGETLDSVSVVTTTANGLVGAIHQRMPVMLDGESVGSWLNPKADYSQLFDLMTPYPEEKMSAHRVGVEVNRASSEGPALVVPVG